MNDTFAAADAPERHDTQYFEIFGNRGIYHKGWSAITKHRTPWQTTGDVGIAFDDDVWELYDGSNRLDSSQRSFQKSTPTSCASCNVCSSSKQPATTSCRSMTAHSSGCFPR